MKAKYLIIGLTAAAVLIGGGLALRSLLSEKTAAKAALSNKSEQASTEAAEAKKTFSKGMGGLTIRILNIMSKPSALRAKAFRPVDSRSAVCIGSLVSNKTRELAPGNYDIELDTVPQKIYKGIKVSAGRETVKNFGHVTGILNVRIMSAKNKAASYPVSIYYPKTSDRIIATMANRPLELLAGTYDIEIGVLPKVMKSSVTIEPGKEKRIDLGVMTGTLIVKVVDQKGIAKRPARQSVKVKDAGTNELITAIKPNRPVEIRQGRYNIELGTVPPQIKKDVKINSGEDAVVEFVINTPSKAKAKKPPAAAVSSSKIALPAKGR